MNPVGEVIDGRLLDNGLKLERRRVPLGVVGVIYEARPNVTVDVASLCLKTGNAVILRCGKGTYRANAATVSVIQRALAQSGPAKVVAMEAKDYDDELLSNDLNVALVDDMDAAIAHIREHGTQHSDAILKRSISNAERFVREVDSSAVYVNASTRFTDGGQLGLGAEVAVSTHKLHARCPMGLEALTTYKWIG